MTGIFIYGSCVSRDTMPFLGEDAQLVYYVARQSAISVERPAVGVADQLPVLPSAFQDRVVRADLAGDLTKVFRARASGIDLVVLDLVDERNGVLELGGGYATPLVEFWKNGGKQLAKGARRVLFGSDEHFSLWSEGMRRVVDTFADGGLSGRIILLDTPWADRLDTGEFMDLPAWMPEPAQINRLLPRYVDYVRDLGVEVASLPAALTRSSRSHKWGPSPFHYCDAAYEWLADQIRGFSRRVGQTTAPEADSRDS